MIDETDMEILAILQNNARTPNAEIARKVGMTTSGIFDRLKRLENKGVIDGYKTLVNPRALGLVLLAFVSVRLQPAREARAVGERLVDIPGIQEVFHMAGEACFLCKVRCRDTEDLEKVLGRINAIDTVCGTQTNIALRAVKESPKLPGLPD